MIVPEQLRANCRNHAEREAWLTSLPARLQELTERWSLRTCPPFDHANVTCSWVAPVVCAGGASAVLKLAMPHMESASEMDGLRFWNGNPTVRLLDADKDPGAMRHWLSLISGLIRDSYAEDCECGGNSESRYPQTCCLPPIFTQETV